MSKELIEQTPVFDYSQLDEDTRTFLLNKEAEMEIVLRRTFEELGRILLEVKARLPHGQYTPWLASKGISQQTAHRWMQIARGILPDKSPILSDLPGIAGEQPTFTLNPLPGYGYFGAHYRAYKPVNGELCYVGPTYATICDWLWEAEAIEEGRHPFHKVLEPRHAEVCASWRTKLDMMIAHSDPVPLFDMATWPEFTAELKEGTVRIEQFSVSLFTLNYAAMIADGGTVLPDLYARRCWEWIE